MKSSLLHSRGWNPGELRRGFVQTIPLGIGGHHIWAGIRYDGAAGPPSPFWMIPAMSLFVFAGSSQMLAAEMMISVPLPLSVIITVLAVNLRHVVMSADMAAHVREGACGEKRRWPPFFLTDEAYAVSYLRFQREKGSVSYILGCGLDIYLFWNLSSVAGYWFGNLVPPLLEPAFGFAMAAAFLSMLIPTVRSRPGAHRGARLRRHGHMRLALAAGKMVYPPLRPDRQRRRLSRGGAPEQAKDRPVRLTGRGYPLKTAGGPPRHPAGKGRTFSYEHPTIAADAVRLRAGDVSDPDAHPGFRRQMENSRESAAIHVLYRPVHPHRPDRPVGFLTDAGLPTPIR